MAATTKPFKFQAGDTVEVFATDWNNPTVLPNGMKTAEQKWLRGTVTDVSDPSEPTFRSKGGIRTVLVTLDQGGFGHQNVGPRGGNNVIRKVA